MGNTDKKKKYRYILAVILLVILLCYLFCQGFMKQEKSKLQTKPHFGSDYRGRTISFQGEKYKYKEQLINILFLGVDKKGTLEEEHERGGIGQTDAVFLVSLDPENLKMKIFVIPRDSMVPVQRLDINGNYYDTQVMQLTLQYAYGEGREKSCELTSQAVSELLYKIPISGYCAVDLKAVRIINDAVGGVDVTVNDDFTWYTDKFKIGETVHLEGDEVMEYLQVRNTNQFATSMSRLERQKGYVSAFLPAAKKALIRNPFLLLSVIKQLGPYMQTDLSAGDIMYLSAVTGKCISNPVEYSTVPGEVRQGEEHEEYYTDDEKLHELMIENFYEKEN